MKIQEKDGIAVPFKGGSETSFKDELFCLRQVLTERYKEIEKKGIAFVSQGRAVENPILTGGKKDSRYSISTIGIITGPLDSFLKEATKKIKEVEPGAQYTLDGFRHLNFREVIFNENGRRKMGISSKTVMAYYQAVKIGLQSAKPVGLELYKVMADR